MVTNSSSRHQGAVSGSWQGCCDAPVERLRKPFEGRCIGASACFCQAYGTFSTARSLAVSWSAVAPSVDQLWQAGAHGGATGWQQQPAIGDNNSQHHLQCCKQLA